tara:strand:+ start:352 stop:531 length:180 start_codon:yes stop_codon:yes gene_type:complete
VGAAQVTLKATQIPLEVIMVEPLADSLCQPLAAALVVRGTTMNPLKRGLMVALAAALRG